MSVWTGLSHYPPTKLERAGKCFWQRCRKEHQKGETVLLRWYQNPHNRKQTIRQIFCDEECWSEWDAHYWEHKSEESEMDREFERLFRIMEEARKEGHIDSAGMVAMDRIADLDAIEEEERREAMRNFAL